MKLGLSRAALGALGAMMFVSGTVPLQAAGARSAAPAQDAGTAEAGPVAPLSTDGTWFVDAEGRVVLLHGVNEVYKRAPYHPAADGFGADDAELLAASGLNVVRLGVEFQGLMPEPGDVDEAYIDALAGTVTELSEAGIFVLLDFHQDGYGPKYTGNGFPEWMSVDDGVENNTDAEFPLYYIENPALQRAFQNFWADREVDGVGLQQHFINGLTAVAERFASEPYVVGYELMNEPWPGEVWQPCIAPEGCTDLEQDLLVPFYRRATAAVREVASTQQVWVEPFVLFNFGQGATSLPGADENGDVLSWHSYALDVAGEEGVARFAQEASQRDDVPGVATEFGATHDLDTVNRILGQVEENLMGWMFWAYNEQIVPGYGGRDDGVPAGDDIADPDLLTALSRPYPTAVTGTPEVSTFDPGSQVYQLSYRTAGPSGRAYPDDLVTTVAVPERQYPDGYEVTVDGATVTSEPDAGVMTLVNDPDAAQVTLTIEPPAGRPGGDPPGSGPDESPSDGDGRPSPAGPDGDGRDGHGRGAMVGRTPPAVAVPSRPSFTG